MKFSTKAADSGVRPQTSCVGKFMNAPFGQTKKKSCACTTSRVDTGLSAANTAGDKMLCQPCR